jgi:hypothetical protein
MRRRRRWLVVGLPLASLLMVIVGFTTFFRDIDFGILFQESKNHGLGSLQQVKDVLSDTTLRTRLKRRGWITKVYNGGHYTVRVVCAGRRYPRIGFWLIVDSQGPLCIGVGVPNGSPNQWKPVGTFWFPHGRTVWRQDCQPEVYDGEDADIAAKLWAD